MKTKLIIVSFLATFIISCMGNGKRGHRSDFLPPIEIQIPNAIKSDAELTNLVKESEKAINEFSDNMEYLIEDLKPYKDVKPEEASTFVKLKLTKIGVDFFTNSTKGLAVMEKLESYSSKRALEQKPLNDEQLKAIAVIYDTFKTRMEQLERKYKDFGGKK